MSRIRKASVLADARNSPVSAERLPANGAAIRTTVEPPAVVYPFPAPPAVPFEEPLRVARAITRISTALERVGFRVGGEKQTAEILASARDARSEMIDVRFYPCGAELGFRTWSGKASALLEILHGMTDGTDSDERVAVTFFTAADDIPTALAIDTDLRAAAWRKISRTLAIASSCPAAEPAAVPEEATPKKPKARGVTRR